ncbi:MAG: MgtC/SapB family protein [Anaerolineae bacterium]|nr:MAG: MgtC/SapB family protein [Anaerolineae bacterium]
MEIQTDLFLRFGAALGIGFLIGLQREYAYGEHGRRLTAGERTFALISLAGALAAMLSDILGAPEILAMVVVGVTLFTGIGHAANAFLRNRVGTTTEVAILVALMLGALCYYGHLTLAAAIGISTTVVLNLKFTTDKFVQALTREDITAALQMAVISVIVLPILPNRSFWEAPLDVLNPFTIWLMVVFISGISFLGYVLIKVAGPHQGIGLTGLLGGLVSSTAVTLSFSQRSREEKDRLISTALAFAIHVAWAIMFARVLGQVVIINAPLLRVVWVPLVAAGLAAGGYSYFLYRQQRQVVSPQDVEFNNPFDLMAALRFGLLYALILLATRAAQTYFGTTGIFASSILSGLLDVNAITISMAQLSRGGSVELGVAAQAITLAVMSNTVVKGGMVLALGSPMLRRLILPGLILTLAAGLATAFLL